ncbi:VPA1269 family protein [Paraburkholderia aromaticivorans]|uniref:VPA1269 family protein n=1 Tax=Paraburkholderia aromaticivorans TaxID=2026199 RepID=UPI003D668021
MHDFLDWIIDKKLTIHDSPDGATAVEFENPVPHIPANSRESLDLLAPPKETLPYRFMQELRSMLAQGNCFRNRDDPDCVWRTRPARKTESCTKNSTVTELWSPVRATAPYCKLEIPLRLFQVRFLDSGETNTWRYETVTIPVFHSQRLMSTPSVSLPQTFAPTSRRKHGQR